MEDLLAAIRNFVQKSMDGVEAVSALDGLENMFVIEMKNGKKYALSLLELD